MISISPGSVGYFILNYCALLCDESKPIKEWNALLCGFEFTFYKYTWMVHFTSLSGAVPYCSEVTLSLEKVTGRSPDVAMCFKSFCTCQLTHHFLCLGLSAASQVNTCWCAHLPIFDMAVSSADMQGDKPKESGSEVKLMSTHCLGFLQPEP